MLNNAILVIRIEIRMDKTGSRLVDYVFAAPRTLSDATVHECKRRIIDTFACAFGGYKDPVSITARSFSDRHHVASGPVIWGQSKPCTEEDAAFANGVMLRVLDLSDTYLSKSRGHPSDVMAGIMAVAEAESSSGLEVIRAVTLAYDVYCSFCDALDINTKGWDQPVYSVIATSMGIGQLLGFDREQLRNTLGLALVPNMAMYQTRMGQLSAWKGCASANASRNAIFAARLVQNGMTGPAEPFEGKSGLFSIVGEFDWQFPAKGEHKINQTHMKCFPICYHGQSSAWAALEARKSVSVPDIREIKVATYRQAVAMMGADASRWAPESKETADHSLPFVVATALQHGEINSSSFVPARLVDRAIRDIMAKVKVEEDAGLSDGYPDTAGCRLSINCGSAAPLVIDVKYPKGHVNLPMEDQQVNAKFTDLFLQFGSARKAGDILKQLWSLEKLERFGDLTVALPSKP